jgi:hypothetical protein
MATLTVNDLLEGHAGLDIESLDRVYLNGYVPNLQVSGQVVSFMMQHLGYPIPSPAIMEKIGTSFRRAVRAFAAAHQVPIVAFGKTDRKQEVMRPHLQRQARTGRSGVAAIGVAQEYQNVFAAWQREDRGSTGHQVWFSFRKADRRVSCFYFYLWDLDFGSAFIKVCAYFPYPVKVWLNGHEWAKRQAIQAGIGFTELSNGFATCDDPAALQAICDRLGPATIEVFFQRAKARAVNTRLLDTERVGQGCVLASPAFERVAQSTLTEDGRRSPALRFGDPRVMALLGALCVGLNALGFTNRSLRAQVSQLLGVAYTVNQMSYDLARLRLNGLLQRRPGTNTYHLTPDGQRVAIFYTKVHDRLLRPLIAADTPPAPVQLRNAMRVVDRHVRGYIDHTRLPQAA